MNTQRNVVLWYDRASAEQCAATIGRCRVHKVSDVCWLTVPDEVSDERINALLTRLHRGSN